MAFRSLQDVQMSLGSLQDEMNRLFERVWHGGVSTGPFDGQEWAPCVDLYEQEDGYTLLVELPGVNGSDVELSYLGNTLTIRGEKTAPNELTDRDRPIRRERRFGVFCRSVELPGAVEADRLSAKCSCGVLVVTIPKPEASKPKTVKIDVEEG